MLSSGDLAHFAKPSACSLAINWFPRVSRAESNVSIATYDYKFDECNFDIFLFVYYRFGPPFEQPVPCLSNYTSAPKMVIPVFVILHIYRKAKSPFPLQRHRFLI